MGEYAVIGLGLFGRSLAQELHDLGHEVIGIDINREPVQRMSTVLRQTIEADATSEETLREIGVANLDAAVVAIGDVEASIMAALLLKRLEVPYVIAKAESDLQGEILRRIGADRVLFPERETAERLAHGIAVPEVVDYLSISSDMGISKLAVPRHFIGRSCSDADIERRFHLRIIAIIRGDRVLFGASVGEVFEPGDVLLVSGRDRDLRAFSQSAI